jgi:hypothetical protein
MAQNELQIKISVEAQLGQLRAMEADFQRQIVRLKTLGATSDEAKAKIKELETGLLKTRAALAGISNDDKLSNALGELVRNIPAVGAAMQGLNGSALPVAATLGVAAAATTSFFVALNQADELQDTADQLDVTTSSLQALNAFFGAAGIKAAAVSQSLLKLRQSLAEAASGSTPAREAFAALGLDWQRLTELAPDAALAEVGRALAAHAESAGSAAAAQTLLGRGTGRLINQLRELGTLGLENVRADAISSGLALEDGVNKQLADANQKLEELDRRWTIIKAKLAVPVVDGFDRYKNGLQNLINAAAGVAVVLSGQGSLGDVNAALESMAAENNAGTSSARPAAPRPVADPAAEAAARASLEAPDRAKFAEAQAALDAKMLDQHTATLAVADQIAVAEAEILRLRSLMPAEENESLAAARTRVDLGAQLFAQAERLRALKAQQATEDKKAQDDDEAWLERTYAAEAERLALRKKDREQDRDRALSRSLSGGDEQFARLDQSRTLLDADRDRQKLAILTRQKEEVAERIALLERELELSPSEDGRARLDALRSKQAGIGANMDGLAPRSLGDGAKEGLASTINQFGSDADIVARGVQASFSGVFEGLRGSIQGLIEGTMTWGDALRNIGSSILSGVISAIAEMFATWIAKRLLIHTLGLSFLAAEGAAETAKEADTLPAKTAGAAAAGISSYGLAIAGGLAAIALIASLSGGFAEGGAVSGPGTGTSDSIFARLSNGEHVMTAAAVQRVGGHGVLDAINAGRIPDLASSPAAGGSSPAAAPAVSMSNHFHFDPNEAMRQALADPAGRRLVTDLLRQIQYEI